MLDKGLVIAGDIQVNLLDIELLTIKLRLVIASLDTAREVGINWWENDPWLSADAGRRAVRGESVRGEVDDGDGDRASCGRRIRRLRGRIQRTGVRAMSEDTGVWAYAITEDGHLSGPDGEVDLSWLTGVGETKVRTATSCGLTVLVSDVSLAEFGEAALRENLENLDWLDEVAREHHYVIDAAARLFPLLPIRLATVYSGDAAAARRARRARRASCATRCAGSAAASSGASRRTRRRNRRRRRAARRSRTGRARPGGEPAARTPSGDAGPGAAPGWRT